MGLWILGALDPTRRLSTMWWCHVFCLFLMAMYSTSDPTHTCSTSCLLLFPGILHVQLFLTVSVNHVFKPCVCGHPLSDHASCFLFHSSDECVFYNSLFYSFYLTSRLFGLCFGHLCLGFFFFCLLDCYLLPTFLNFESVYYIGLVCLNLWKKLTLRVCWSRSGSVIMGKWIRFRQKC